MVFSENFIERLKNSISIVDVIGAKIALKKRGNVHLGLCPFHNEKTPSFNVNEQKQFYHCFGCGASGDIITFWSKTKNLSFAEAVETIAKHYGVKLPENKENSLKIDSQAVLFSLLNDASKFFVAQLHSYEGSKALKYLNLRGLGADVIERFSIGYAPKDSNLLLQTLRKLGYSYSDMQKVGLIKNIDKPSAFFWERIIFPIRDVKDRVVAFGGRVLDDAKPKYLNSPETDLFKKKEILFGFNDLQKKTLFDNEVIVVEGYMDAISLISKGYNEVVATLGTAISQSHLKLLWKISSKPVLCMDGDLAGFNAAKRASSSVLPYLIAGKSLNFAFLPEGQDPDDVVKVSGVKRLKEIIQKKVSLAEFLWESALKGQDETHTPESQAALKAFLNKLCEEIKDNDVKKFYKNYFNDRIWKKFSEANKLISGKIKSFPLFLGESLTEIQRLEAALCNIVYFVPELLCEVKIREFFCEKEPNLPELKEFYNSVTASLSNEVFILQDIKDKMKTAIESEKLKQVFMEVCQFSFASLYNNIDEARKLWNLCHQKLILAKLKHEYGKKIVILDEQSQKHAFELKKQIEEYEKLILNND